jgi:glycosyltransferase involved in cell wall biosynthesis
MRIVFVTFSVVPFGSSDLLFFRTAENLLSAGHKVLISSYDWGEKNPREYAAIANRGAVVCTRPRGEPSPLFLNRQWQKIRHKIVDHRKAWRFIERFAPNIVVINDPGTFYMTSASGFVEYLLDKQFPFVTISNYNDENPTLSETNYQRARRFFNKARYCVFVSQRNLDVARRQLCLKLSHGVVTGNPPNLELPWETLPFPSGQPIKMAMAARLECAVKGQALVLEVLAQGKWANRKWELNIYGRGPDETYLHELIAFFGLQEKVRLCGHTTNIRAIWMENQLLIMASSGEGRPLALAEAMLCGRPALVTDVGGNAELISEGVTGFVAESATLASLDMTLDRAWEQREHWRSMGVHAHDFMIRSLQPRPEQLLFRLLNEAGEHENP